MYLFIYLCIYVSSYLLISLFIFIYLFIYWFFVYLDNLKLEGQRILDKYSPENQKVGKINTHSIFWIISSIAVFYYTDFYISLKVDPNIDR